MLEFLCGPIDSVMAEMTDLTSRGTYRALVLALHIGTGAVGSLVGSYDASYAYPDTHQVELNGTEGRIVIQDTVRRYAFSAKGSETAEVLGGRLLQRPGPELLRHLRSAHGCRPRRTSEREAAAGSRPRGEASAPPRRVGDRFLA